MDPLTHDREMLEKVLTEYARIPFYRSDVERQTIFDRTRDHYLVMLVGREGIRRVHGCLIHVDIINGKFWIQRDGTEYGIARELLDSGVPKSRIVLAFHSPELRQHTDFAVA
jgi:hypothetical protein